MAEPQMKSIEPIKRNALSEFEITPAIVKDMAEKYMVMTVPEGDNGAYKQVRSALTTCVKTRTGVDKRRKDLGSDARKWISEVNEAAKELVEPLAPVEAHLKSELTREDDRKAEIKAEEDRIEAERIEKIRGKIADIGSMVTSLNGMDSDVLRQVVADIDAIELPPEEYQELVAEANLTKHNAYIAAQEALDARIKWEKEEADRKSLAERLAKQKAEQEAEAARLEGIRKEQERKEREANERAEAERKAAEEKAQKERDAIAAERRKIEEEKAAFEKMQREAKEQKEREERESEEAAAAKIQAEKDAADKAAQEKAEAEAKKKADAEEAARLEALRPDMEKLTALAADIKALKTPVVESPEAKDILIDALNLLARAAMILEGV